MRVRCGPPGAIPARLRAALGHAIAPALCAPPLAASASLAFQAVLAFHTVLGFPGPLRVSGYAISG